jgi:hypothetical protein
MPVAAFAVIKDCVRKLVHHCTREHVSSPHAVAKEKARTFIGLTANELLVIRKDTHKILKLVSKKPRN